MAFYIVQHGLSLPKGQDPEKGLAPQGIEDVKSDYQFALSNIVVYAGGQFLIG